MTEVTDLDLAIETVESAMTDYEVMVSALTHTGVKFEEVDERQLVTDHPVPHAVKYLSVMVAHLHFDAEGKFLGTECNGDGTFVHSTK